MTTTNLDIDSLPATPETVGMPKVGDEVRCAKCRLHSIVDEHGSYLTADGMVLCWCGSYDVEKVNP